MNRYAPLYIGAAGQSEELTPELAGSKAALIWQMKRLGLNVPPAFVLPTALCAPVNRNDPQALVALDQGLIDGIARLEETTGRRLGGDRAPLLVSVRSGAAKSMPGMLATILDVGLNAQSVRGLIGLTGNPRLAWDSYRRFIETYSEIVNGAPSTVFAASLAELMRSENVETESNLDSEALERLTHDFRALAAKVGGGIPDNPIEQLEGAARAVYRSWESPRAEEYRRLYKLDRLDGTAVTIQAMVFGNAGGNLPRFHACTRRGLALELLNLGGGLPAHYRAPIPPLSAYAEAIETALAAEFGGSRPRILVEPGRYLVGDAGLYNGLDETLDERIHYRIRTPREGGLCGPVILAPPATARISSTAATPTTLPLDLAIGDPLDFLSGAPIPAALPRWRSTALPRSAAISSDVDSGQMVGVVGDHEPPAHNHRIKGAARTKMSPHRLVRRRRPGSRSVVSNITEIL